jgi:hypothetical protein
MKERYIPIRPGILEHLLRGDISAFEFGVYVIVHLQADYRTGIWRGSAPRIIAAAPRGAELRKTQRALEHLTELSLLKPFTSQGKRGNYPVLINKFTVRSGALTGMRLNACKSNSWEHPVYESCADGDAEGVAEDAPIQEVRSKEGRKPQHPASAPTAADSLEFDTKQSAFDLFWEKWPRKADRADARRAWLKIPIAEYPAIMAGLEKFLTCEQWSRGIIPHASTWLNKKRWLDEDIPQFSLRGGSNGNRKPTVNDNIEQTLATLRAAGQVRPN